MNKIFDEIIKFFQEYGIILIVVFLVVNFILLIISFIILIKCFRERKGDFTARHSEQEKIFEELIHELYKEDESSLDKESLEVDNDSRFK